MNQNKSLVYHCGFGGCKAPVAPVPMLMPGLWTETGNETTTRRDVRRQDMLIPVMHLGFGGCSAPAKPVPVYCPDVHHFAMFNAWERFGKRAGPSDRFDAVEQ